MANSREEKGHFGTDSQQGRAPQQVYDRIHNLQYYSSDSDEEDQIVSNEHRHDLRQLIYPTPQWEYPTAGGGNTNVEPRQYPNRPQPYLLSPHDDSDDSDESYYDTDDVELFMRRHEEMGKREADKVAIPGVDALTLVDTWQEDSDLEQAIKLSLEEFNAKEKMEKIKLEQEKKKQEDEKIREEIVKNYEMGLLQQKEKKVASPKIETDVDSDVAEYQFFCEEPAEGSEDGEDPESDEAVYYSDD